MALTTASGTSASIVAPRGDRLAPPSLSASAATGASRRQCHSAPCTPAPAATALHTRHLGGAVIGASPPARPHKSATIARVPLYSATRGLRVTAPVRRRPRRRRWPTPRRAESSLSTRLRPRRPSTCPVPWRSRRTRPGRRTAPCPSPLPSVALGGATGALARWLRLCTSPDPYPEPDDTGAMASSLMPTLALARLGRGDPRLRPAPVAAAQPTLTPNQARHGHEPPGWTLTLSLTLSLTLTLARATRLDPNPKPNP
eukprot:scaffold16884_cov45-Phaeocystis_antarctica.AAC.1